MARNRFQAFLACPKCGNSGQATYSELDLQYPGDCGAKLVELPAGFSKDKENSDQVCCENCFEAFVPT